MKRSALTCLLALLLCGCPSPRQSLPSPVAFAGERHNASGINFPLRVGTLQRTGVTRYDKAGDDIGAGYDSTDRLLRLFATVYVYPSPPLTSIGSPQDVVNQARSHLAENEYERTKLEIVNQHPDAKLIEQRQVAHNDSGMTYHGALAIYEYNFSFGGPPVPVRSYLYLFCYFDGKWSIKYRFTHPKDVDAQGAIEAFLIDFKWKTP